MIKRIIIFSIIILLLSLIGISGYYIHKQISEENKQESIFNDLSKIIQVDEENSIEDNLVSNNDINNCNITTDNINTTIRLDELYKQNKDLIGWIKIDGTNIDYPVMQTKNNEEYYLHRNFYKEYSSYGTPFISSSYNIESSENMIIYGHHMNNMQMFGILEKYKNKEFYNTHKTIKLYTLNGIEEYEIFAVFKTTLYTSNTFKYYQNIELDTEAEYYNYISNCTEHSFYNTNIKPNYKNKLITLSTCEYSAKNSRLVVVGVLKE